MTLGLGIDPGKRRAGVALYNVEQRRIIAAGLVKGLSEGEGPRLAAVLGRNILDWVEARSGMSALAISVLAVEWPRTYGGRASRGDTNSLFPLAALDGAMAAMLPDTSIVHYEPSAWKGGVQKPETTKEPYPIEGKVRRRLVEQEPDAIAWPKDVKHSWDVTDALGIALTAMGRFERIRVYASE